MLFSHALKSKQPTKKCIFPDMPTFTTASMDREHRMNSCEYFPQTLKKGIFKKIYQIPATVWHRQKKDHVSSRILITKTTNLSCRYD